MVISYGQPVIPNQMRNKSRASKIKKRKGKKYE